jgi:hypothetical protein
MMKIMETDGADLGAACELNEYARSVECSSYGVLYHHEFPRVNDMPVISDDAREAMRSKLQYKYNKMNAALSDADGEGVVFVRYGGFVQPAAAWPYLHDPEALTEVQLNELMALLKRKYPRINSRLLFTWPSPFARTDIRFDELHPDIYAAALPPPTVGEASWNGEDAPWTQVFNAAFKHWGAEMTTALQGLDPNSLSH